MSMTRLAEWRRWATAGGWPRLGLLSCAAWVALVALMALMSSDPGQNIVAYMLIGPSVVLLSLGYAGGWVSRSLPTRGTPSDEPDTSARGGSLPQQQPVMWWGAILVGIAAVAGAFALPSGVDDADTVRRSVRLAASLVAIVVVALFAYRAVRPRTSAARAQFLLAMAFAGGAFVLWQGFDETQRVAAERPASATAETKATKDSRVAERAKSNT